MTPPSIEPTRVYRTPAHRFHGIPDFAYEPHYGHWGNLRYAYIDVTGPVIDLKVGQAVDYSPAHPVRTETVLCLHGEPTWSFLYRKMIPGLLSSLAPRRGIPDSQRYVQRRVIVPDLLGFGRSDKPIDDEVYTFDFHREWLVHFVTTHILHDSRTGQGGRVTLVVQDWGGILGLLLPSLFPALFTHLLVMNTGLGVGKVPSESWKAFRDFIKRSPDVDVGGLLARGTPLRPDEVAAYRAPFDGQHSKAGVRRFPELVPAHPSMRGAADSRAALTYYQSLPPIAYTSNSLAQPSAPQSQGQHGSGLGEPLQVFVCVGKADPVLGEPVMASLARTAWGSSCGYWWHVIPDGGHFVQEWAAHVPALADRAWASDERAGTLVCDDWQAVWVHRTSRL